MTSQSIARILKTYEQIAPRIDDMVAGFYERLFSICPEARSLFKRDMTIQRHHLAATLAMLVRNLQFQDLLQDAVMDLGAQHVMFGARPEQYPMVRDSLLYSLSNALGDDWTPQVEADWRALLDNIIIVMLKGATKYVMEKSSRKPPLPSRDTK